MDADSKEAGVRLAAQAARAMEEHDARLKLAADAGVQREISRRLRRPKAQRMLKLAKKAQDKGDNEIAEMWVRRALK